MKIEIRGDQYQTGVYLLGIRVRHDLEVTFGRFRGGQSIDVPAGIYLYAGSARGRSGATSLAGRLLRHASRGDPSLPHAIRDDLVSRFRAVGLVPPANLPADKQLHWHIDYLLDDPAAELIAVFAIRTTADLEPALANRLASRPDILPLAKGLGASDRRGRTHLMRLVTGGRSGESEPPVN